MIWPFGGIFVTCHDGHRIRLAHNNCSTVIGSDRMRRPVAWYTALATAAGRPTILFDGLIVHLLRESRKGRGGAFPIPARQSIFTVSWREKVMTPLHLRILAPATRHTPVQRRNPSLWLLLGNWRQKANTQALLMLTDTAADYRPSNFLARPHMDI
jgi:hypothetical protein